MSDRYEGLDDDRLEAIHEDKLEELLERALARQDLSNYPPDLGDKTDDYR